MSLQKRNLIAGQYAIISERGSNVHLILAAGDIRVRITKDNEQIEETLMVEGMSFVVKEGYKQVAIISDVAQVIKIWLGYLPLQYSPLELKTVGASSLTQQSNSLFFGKVTELLPAALGRGKVTFQANKQFNIGGVGSTLNNTITVPAGEKFSISTQSAIYGHSLDTDDIAKEISTPELPMTIKDSSGNLGTVLDIYFNHVLGELVGYKSFGQGFTTLDQTMTTWGASVANGGSFELIENSGYIEGDTLVVYGVTYSKLVKRVIELADYSYSDFDMSGGVSFSGGIGGLDVLGDRYIIRHGANSGDNVTYGYLNGDAAQVVDLSTLPWTSKIAQFSAINKDGDIAIIGRDGACAVTSDLGATWVSTALAYAIASVSSKLTANDVAEGRLYVCNGSLAVYSEDGGHTYPNVLNIPEISGRASPIIDFRVVGGFIYILNRDGALFYNKTSDEWFTLETNTVLGGDMTPLTMTQANNGKIYITTQNSKSIIELAGKVEIIGGLRVSIMSELN